MPRELRNEAIHAEEVRLYDEGGADLGFVQKSDALALAKNAMCDLVQDGAFSSPPICRLIAVGTQQQSAPGSVKELRLTTKIGKHDIDTKIRQARALLQKGHVVKLAVKLEKQERSNPVQARALLESMIRDLSTDAVIDGKIGGQSGSLVVLLISK